MGRSHGSDMRFRTVVGALLVGALPSLVANACSDEEVNAGATTSGTGASASTEAGGASVGGAGGGGASAAGGFGACGPTQCTDCIDNDGDGQTDSWDVECISPLDDDEGAFKTGIPGDNVDPCKQDCFFDGNSGQGDDGCEWDLACDPKNPGDPECPYDPNKMNCPEVEQKCIDACLGITPNGCDCFGCCEIVLADQTVVTIAIGFEGCTEETAKDPTICKPCTQQQDCLNPCEPCEYCLGKVVLPRECDDRDGGMGGDGGSGPGCSPCAPEFPCPAGEYCLTGCCIPQ